MPSWLGCALGGPLPRAWLLVLSVGPDCSWSGHGTGSARAATGHVASLGLPRGSRAHSQQAAGMRQDLINWQGKAPGTGGAPGRVAGGAAPVPGRVVRRAGGGDGPAARQCLRGIGHHESLRTRRQDKPPRRPFGSGGGHGLGRSACAGCYCVASCNDYGDRGASTISVPATTRSKRGWSLSLRAPNHDMTASPARPTARGT
jgi:hypothetical protein